MDQDQIDSLTGGEHTDLHHHDEFYYTEAELSIDGVLDDRYYTETEIDAQWTAHEGAADPHTPYLLADGSRPLTADWSDNAGNIILNNNKYFGIKRSTGALVNMVYFNTSNQIWLGHASYQNTIQGNPIKMRVETTSIFNATTTLIDSLIPFTIGSTVEIDSILDQDDFYSDSDTALATQQSIKAYVDTETVALDGTRAMTGALTINANYMRLQAASGGSAKIEIVGDDGEDNADFWRIESATDNKLKFANYGTGAWVDKMELDTDGNLFIDKGLFVGETANANNTLGVTINQDTADDEFFSGKSSDVSHLCASITETDTFAFMKKIATVLGGLNITGMGGDGANTTTIQLNGYGGTADTTKSTSGRGLCEINLYEHTGAGGVANITAEGNILAIRAQVGGSLQSRWICDEDGKTWQAGDLEIEGTWDLGAILTTNETYRGKTILVNVDDSGVVFGHVLAQAADFNYDRADADAAANSVGLVMALEAANGTDKKVLTEGMVCDTDWNWSAGLLYLSTAAGGMTQTAPSGTGDQVVAVGWALSADTIYFKPSLVLAEVA